MKLQDSNGRSNHIVPFSNGALRPPYLKQIGPAYPLFLLYEDKVTRGAGGDEEEVTPDEGKPSVDQVKSLGRDSDE